MNPSTRQPIPYTPPHILEAREEYKAATKIALNWLNGTRATISESDLAISQLESAAQNARINNITPPGHVYRAFQDAISKRRLVTEWYTDAEQRAEGKASETTRDHIHFTDTLQKAFKTLFPPRQEERSSSREVENAGNPPRVNIQSRNPFEVLPTEEHDPEPELDIDSSPDREDDSQPSPEPVHHPSESEPAQLQDTPILVDDPIIPPMREVFRGRMNSIVEAIKSFWEWIWRRFDAFASDSASDSPVIQSPQA